MILHTASNAIFEASRSTPDKQEWDRKEPCVQKSVQFKPFGGSAPQAEAGKAPVAGGGAVTPPNNIPNPPAKPAPTGLAVPLPQNAPALWPWVSAVATLVGLIFWLQLRSDQTPARSQERQMIPDEPR